MAKKARLFVYRGVNAAPPRLFDTGALPFRLVAATFRRLAFQSRATGLPSSRSLTFRAGSLCERRSRRDRAGADGDTRVGRSVVGPSLSIASSLSRSSRDGRYRHRAKRPTAGIQLRVINWSLSAISLERASPRRRGGLAPSAPRDR